MLTFRTHTLSQTSVLKMEILCFSETLAPTDKSTRRQNQEKHLSYRRGDLKSHNSLPVPRYSTFLYLLAFQQNVVKHWNIYQCQIRLVVSFRLVPSVPFIPFNSVYFILLEFSFVVSVRFRLVQFSFEHCLRPFSSILPISV
jgi:hypothetical protein